MIKMDYMSTDRVELRYTIPLAEVVIDFFDALKSRTKATPASTTNRVATSRHNSSASTS